MNVTGLVLEEIEEERIKQDRKWGEQNHPDVSQVLLRRKGGATAESIAEDLEIPSATRAKFLCDSAHGQNKDPSWAVIAVEELAEAVEEAALGRTQHLRTELIQTAAVLVAWVEAIDRRTK